MSKSTGTVNCRIANRSEWREHKLKEKFNRGEFVRWQKAQQQRICTFGFLTTLRYKAS
jgi:hypothetical protein